MEDTAIRSVTFRLDPDPLDRRTEGRQPRSATPGPAEVRSPSMTSWRRASPGRIDVAARAVDQELLWGLKDQIAKCAKLPAACPTSGIRDKAPRIATPFGGERRAASSLCSQRPKDPIRKRSTTRLPRPLLVARTKGDDLAASGLASGDVSNTEPRAVTAHGRHDETLMLEERRD